MTHAAIERRCEAALAGSRSAVCCWRQPHRPRRRSQRGFPVRSRWMRSRPPAHRLQHRLRARRTPHWLALISSSWRWRTGCRALHGEQLIRLNIQRRIAASHVGGIAPVSGDAAADGRREYINVRTYAVHTACRSGAMAQPRKQPCIGVEAATADTRVDPFVKTDFVRV